MPVECADAASWARWLERHHGNAAGVWLRIAKKDSGIASIDHPAALEEALCWGWIDGQRKSDDAQYFLQRFTPRTKRSTWSQINRAKVLKLIEEGRMQPAGHAEIERAKADGRWDAAYEGVAAATVPPDLQAALDANKKAAKFFATLDSRNRFAVLFRTQGAKKPETRARRIAQFVEMLAKGEKIHP
ncbi:MULTISPECIES: YdeI/OmpD-associated family protein [Variovorax]|uniref:YdeI/OmpD-associated family protein n=1 Tax=Variovorax TaxID=34072 RepID=UPI00086BD8FE|nr:MULTISPECIES: YdeI/OmpD-associated family protein [Variovorax]MBN8752665.1 YdeI/OmpD-associated family protein [Variovorax sp.]ODU16452.1 MAG: bacteriocin-protection protein [Variovorax sp. SCN 67-85]ODV26069.1 MAG: bacteriocin-protection protein [Variovorax sp. SCN 67-20]OJZ10415.1 MAG: bacteriocin-protection protein [Variovorax sp. 67-131]UKI11965.1 YdeI/OmpD-associated family protein [Variovorax paradoxus]